VRLEQEKPKGNERGLRHPSQPVIFLELKDENLTIKTVGTKKTT
jgi:hypothetical protein